MTENTRQRTIQRFISQELEALANLILTLEIPEEQQDTIPAYILEQETEHQPDTVAIGNRCIAILKSNESRCTNSKKFGYFCGVHKSQNNSIDLNECIICYEEQKIKPFRCGHLVCFSCVKKLKSILCPMCRTDIMKDLKNI